MPKHNPSNINSTKEKVVEKVVENIETVFVPEAECSFSSMVSLIDANIHVTGAYSGREYVFNGSGAVQDVDNRDVEWMLEKRQGERQCCGGTERGNRVFALWENN